MGSNMKKIEFTYGRKVVPIPNNETVQSASFGVAEDDFYFDATKYAKVLVKGPVRQILSPVLSKLKSISRLDRCEYATEATDILRCTQSGVTVFMKTVTAVSSTSAQDNVHSHVWFLWPSCVRPSRVCYC